MCDDEIHPGLIQDPTISRRRFGLLTAALTGVATVAYADDSVVEKDVEVKTPDGLADAVLFHPKGKGKWPAVLVWPDIWSLRPVFRQMARRLASSGYVVLVPNLYYRTKKAPVMEGAMSFANPQDRETISALARTVTPTTAVTDAIAFVAYLDAQPQTNKAKRVGVQGYCMGGPLAFRTAGATPSRIGAVASFHGGGLTAEGPDSPQLLIPKTKANYLVAVADNDDKRDPASKDKLKAAFAEAKIKATVEVYVGANHGWTVPGSQAYNEPAAEKAWTELLTLYKTSLG